MSEHAAGCGCAQCQKVADALRDNPRGKMTPEEWAEREKKAGRGRFDVRHFGKDKPGGPSDPHYKVMDRLAGRPVLTPLRVDEEGSVVGGCDPMAGSVGDLVPAIKELQEGYVFHPVDERFDLVEDIDQDPGKDASRLRWGIYDRAAGTMVVPKTKKGVVLSGFKTKSAAGRWLKANRKSIAKFTCPSTERGRRNLKKKIAARSPEVQQKKRLAAAMRAAKAALKKSKKDSQAYLHATEVIKAIEAGRPIPEKPKKVDERKTIVSPPPEMETSNGKGKKGFRVPMPSEVGQPSAEPEHFRGRVPLDNPGGVTDARFKKLEQRVGAVEKNQDALVGAVDNLNKGLRNLGSATKNAFNAMGATKNVMKAFESGKGKAKK